MEIDIRAKTTDGNEILTPNAIDYYKAVINLILEQISVSLDLSSLEAIIIPDNYKEGLFEFQKQKNLHVGYTENDMGVGQAMVETYTEGGQTKRVIFFNKLLSFIDDNMLNTLDSTLKDDTVKLRQMAVNLLHHELGHVHEYSLTDKLYLTIKCNEQCDNFTKQLREAAQTIWSEYFACRISCSTCYNISDQIENLIEQAGYVKETMDKEIYSYRYHGDINKLVSELHLRVMMLMKYSAYLHGNLYFFETEDRKEIIGKVSGLLQENYFSEVWNLMGDNLENLYNLFPNWTSKNAFDDLGLIVKFCMNKLGFFPETRAEGIYYDVPFAL